MTKAVKLSHDWFPGALPQNVNIGERSWLYSSFAFRHYNSECSCGVNVGHDTGLYNGTFFDLGPNGEVIYCSPGHNKVPDASAARLSISTCDLGPLPVRLPPLNNPFIRPQNPGFLGLFNPNSEATID